MSFETGQLVIYDGKELCRLDGICKRCFDGVNSEEYYRLIPENNGVSGSSCYYVPIDRLEERVRKLLTREEICSAIDESNGEPILCSDDKNRRKAILNETVKSGDSGLLIRLIRELLNEKKQRSEIGKGLVSSDEKALNAACRVISSEFSVVLGIPCESIGDFIEERLAAKGI